MVSPRGGDRLIVALDLPTADQAVAIADELGEQVRVFKVGLELLVAGEWLDLIRRLGDKEFFVDLKLPGDIPTTIERVVRVCQDLRVKFITLSESVRAPTVAAARAARGESGHPKLLAVTLLSSIDRDEFHETHGRPASEMEEFIVERSRAMLDAGCDGLIASGREIASVRKSFPGALIVSPGIRPRGLAAHDHRRVTTPTEALEMGADYLVVGRPITRAPNPGAMAGQIIREIELFDSRLGGSTELGAAHPGPGIGLAGTPSDRKA